jgi:hypothetical protein
MCFRTSMRLTVVAVTLLLAHRTMFCDDDRLGKHTNLILTVQKSADKSSALPGSALYQADLINQTEETVTLQAVQMPGGYIGEGNFFYCSLEGWKNDQHRWVLLWSSQAGFAPNSGAVPPPNLRDVGLKPGERVQVCSMLLPSQAGKDGECVRYRLRTSWNRNHSQRVLLSDPFVIGEKPPVRGSPCRVN